MPFKLFVIHIWKQWEDNKKARRYFIFFFFPFSFLIHASFLSIFLFLESLLKFCTWYVLGCHHACALQVFIFFNSFNIFKKIIVMHVASFLFSNYYIINLIPNLYCLNFLQFALETQPQDDGKTNRYFTFYFFNKKFGIFFWKFSLNNYMLLSHTHVHYKSSFLWFIQHFVCFCCCFACYK